MCLLWCKYSAAVCKLFSQQWNNGLWLNLTFLISALGGSNMSKTFQKQLKLFLLQPEAIVIFKLHNLTHIRRVFLFSE